MNSYCFTKWLPHADVASPKPRSTLKAVAVLRFVPLFGCFKASYSFRSAVVTNAMANDLHSAFLLSLSWAPQLSLDIAADSGLLCAKRSILGDAIKWTLWKWSGVEVCKALLMLLNGKSGQLIVGDWIKLSGTDAVRRRWLILAQYSSWRVHIFLIYCKCFINYLFIIYSNKCTYICIY
jgi:hypothetical protein